MIYSRLRSSSFKMTCRVNNKLFVSCEDGVVCMHVVIVSLVQLNILTHTLRYPKYHLLPFHNLWLHVSSQIICHDAPMKQIPAVWVTPNGLAARRIGETSGAFRIFSCRPFILNSHGASDAQRSDVWDVETSTFAWRKRACGECLELRNAVQL